ncbi:MFS transporter [Pseudonocardia nematodicida]|uniref:MFS transporter n=1 Tax=Pseudonocardia nematodicida TaxID=1206997 RepID=A0ABV1K4E0_9PSEU
MALADAVGALGVDLAACLLAFPVALFPMVNEVRFGGDPRITGAFLSALAVGGLLAALFSGAVTGIRRSGAVQLTAALSWGLAVAGFGLAGHLGAALVCLLVAGAADSISVIVRAALVQAETPDAYRGRVSSTELVAGIAGPELGNVRGGLVASLTSAPVALVTGGLAAAAVIGVIGARNRPLRDYRAPG